MRLGWSGELPGACEVQDRGCAAISASTRIKTKRLLSAAEWGLCSYHRFQKDHDVLVDCRMGAVQQSAPQMGGGGRCLVRPACPQPAGRPTAPGWWLPHHEVLAHRARAPACRRMPRRTQPCRLQWVQPAKTPPSCQSKVGLLPFNRRAVCPMPRSCLSVLGSCSSWCRPIVLVEHR